MARNSKNRKEKYRIAIIGEGHTEWHYFDSLRTEKRYSFQISPELPKHSDYLSIFQHAIKLAGQGYDEVFCVLDLDVFDKNKLLMYEVKKNQMLKKHNKIKVFENLPCFELWFLLHFTEFSSKIYLNSQSLLHEIKKYLPEYDKKIEFFKKVKLYNFVNTLGDEQKAISNAERLCAALSENSSLPFSKVYEILKKLEIVNAFKK